MYEMFGDKHTASEDEMIAVRKHGRRMQVRDNDVEITAYLFNERVYIDDVKHLKGSDDMRKQGSVKWFDNQKGYGFIQCDDGKDVFVHFSAIKSSGYKTLNEGARVDFEVTQGKKGLQAEDVELIK